MRFAKGKLFVFSHYFSFFSFHFCFCDFCGLIFCCGLNLLNFDIKLTYLHMPSLVGA